MGAYWLIHRLRRLAPRRFHWRGATFQTIGEAFLKVAARITELRSTPRRQGRRTGTMKKGRPVPHHEPQTRNLQPAPQPNLTKRRQTRPIKRARTLKPCRRE
jgi:hypothetical protein